MANYDYKSDYYFNPTEIDVDNIDYGNSRAVFEQSNEEIVEPVKENSPPKAIELDMEAQTHQGTIHILHH